VRDLGLPKDKAEYLTSFMKEQNWLEEGTKVDCFQDRDKNFRKYFTKSDKPSVVYCHDVEGLMNKMKLGDEWRLFLDSSTRSFKAVLLHNTNVYASIPILHSMELKENYENVQLVLEKIKYSEHHWYICGDLKILTIILGQQSGYTLYPCFLCLWNSRKRDEHYKRKGWPERITLQKGTANVIHKSLVDPKKVLLPSLQTGLDEAVRQSPRSRGHMFPIFKTTTPEIIRSETEKRSFR